MSYHDGTIDAGGFNKGREISYNSLEVIATVRFITLTVSALVEGKHAEACKEWLNQCPPLGVRSKAVEEDYWLSGARIPVVEAKPAKLQIRVLCRVTQRFRSG
jgi:hypothetical protein